MMIKLKNIDDKFKQLGFRKVKENKYGVTYKRKDEKYNYTHVLDLSHKSNGQHLIQSYSIDVSKKNDENDSVGLTMYEAQLCVKKMKQMGWKISKRKSDSNK